MYYNILAIFYLGPKLYRLRYNVAQWEVGHAIIPGIVIRRPALSRMDAPEIAGDMSTKVSPPAERNG